MQHLIMFHICVLQWDQHAGKAALHASLEQERKGVLVFVDVLLLEVLTPLQEAWLDAVAPTRHARRYT